MKSERKLLIKNRVMVRDGLVCCYCDSPLDIKDVTMEHIVPISKGGTFNPTNLTVSCKNCNTNRGSQSFFIYCQQYNFDSLKIAKYKKLYFSNLEIKILNIAKEECLQEDFAIPNHLILAACNIMKINKISYKRYEDRFDLSIKFDETSPKSLIKKSFELLIRIIDSDI